MAAATAAAADAQTLLKDLQALEKRATKALETAAKHGAADAPEVAPLRQWLVHVKQLCRRKEELVAASTKVAKLGASSQTPVLREASAQLRLAKDRAVADGCFGGKEAASLDAHVAAFEV